MSTSAPPKPQAAPSEYRTPQQLPDDHSCAPRRTRHTIRRDRLDGPFTSIRTSRRGVRVLHPHVGNSATGYPCRVPATREPAVTRQHMKVHSNLSRYLIS
jgi:hypothetical protein